jgi:hypothetical protein
MHDNGATFAQPSADGPAARRDFPRVKLDEGEPRPVEALICSDVDDVMIEAEGGLFLRQSGARQQRKDEGRNDLDGRHEILLVNKCLVGKWKLVAIERAVSMRECTSARNHPEVLAQ